MWFILKYFHVNHSKGHIQWVYLYKILDFVLPRPALVSNLIQNQLVVLKGEVDGLYLPGEKCNSKIDIQIK